MSEWGLEVPHLRGQGNDGVENMAGRFSGCAAIISEQYPKALYVHYSSHCLVLCFIAAGKITAISNMWSALLEISIFFKYSHKQHSKLELAIKAHADNQSVTKLVDLYKTRRLARSTAFVTLEALCEYVIATFEEVSTGSRAEWNADSQVSAAPLLRSLMSFHFIVSFIITARVVTRLHFLTSSLHSEVLLPGYH